MIPDQILTTLALYDRMLPKMLSEIVANHPGCEDQYAVNAAIVTLIDAGQIEVDGAYLVHVPVETDLSAYLAAADSYRRAHTPSLSQRIGNWISWAWHRMWGGVVLIIATAFLTIGLCAQDCPDRIIRALVQIESGCDWRNTGDVRGTWSRGADGEASPFQLAPIALASMGVTDIRRVHRDTVWAESLCRLYLSRCYERHGNWPMALAAYNAGSRYRTRAARDYSARILNLATAN